MFADNPEFNNLTSYLSPFSFSSQAKGLGDDGSLFEFGDELWAISSDVSVEGVHYLEEYSSLDLSLEKSVVSNLSDIQAMGGKCKYLFFNLVAHSNWSTEKINSLFSTLAKLEKKYQFQLMGGDFSRSSKQSVFSFTAMGKVVNKPLLRSNAIPGHKIYVTGFLGLSRAGLFCLENEIKSDDSHFFVSSHRLPTPCLDVGTYLSNLSSKFSVIDISDGLSSEVNHLASASKTKFVLDKEKLPIHKAFSESSLFTTKQIDEFVLNGGEEYQLLFTGHLTENQLAEIRKKTSCHEIGSVEEGKGVYLKCSSSNKLLPALGWSIDPNKK